MVVLDVNWTIVGVVTAVGLSLLKAASTIWNMAKGVATVEAMCTQNHELLGQVAEKLDREIRENNRSHIDVIERVAAVETRLDSLEEAVRK